MNVEPPGGPGPVPPYTRVPGAVSNACESLLAQYVAGLGATLTPELMQILRGADAAQFGQALALEALTVLAERRGQILDLYFARLDVDERTGALAAAAMPDLVAFLRARLFGQNAVLRLPAGTPPVGPTLVLIAGQAISEAGGDRREALGTVLSRLRQSPIELRVPPGDLGYALDGVEGYPPEEVRRDQIRRMLTGAVPLSAAGLAGDQLWLALNLSARPDIRDLARIFAVEPMPGGAETRTEWSLLADTPALARLSIDCLEPVLVRFAIAFDLSTHGEVLREAARTDHLFVVDREPGLTGAEQERLPALLIPHKGSSLAQLLTYVDAERRDPGAP